MVQVGGEDQSFFNAVRKATIEDGYNRFKQLGPHSKVISKLYDGPDAPELIVNGVKPFLFGHGEDGTQEGVTRKLDEFARRQGDGAAIAREIRAVFDEGVAAAPVVGAHENAGVTAARQRLMSEYFDAVGRSLANARVPDLANAFSDYRQAAKKAVGSDRQPG